MPQLFSNEAINAFKMLKRGLGAGLREWGDLYADMRMAAEEALAGRWKSARRMVGSGARGLMGRLVGAYSSPQQVLGTTSRLAQIGYYTGFALPVYGIGATGFRYLRGGSLFYDEYGRPDVAFLPFF